MIDDNISSVSDFESKKTDNNRVSLDLADKRIFVSEPLMPNLPAVRKHKKNLMSSSSSNDDLEQNLEDMREVLYTYEIPKDHPLATNKRNLDRKHLEKL